MQDGAVINQPCHIDRAKTVTTTEEHLAEKLAEKAEKDEIRPGISIVRPGLATLCSGLGCDFRDREFWAI